MKKKAIALKYEKTYKYKAPEIVAQGSGFIAEKILELAKKSNVPVVEDENLADELSKLPLNKPIPVELYEAVAEIIAFVYNLEKKHTKG